MDNGMLAELQASKAVEYLLAAGFLVLFVPFWRYAAPHRPGRVEVREPRRASARLEPSMWFQVPDGVGLHPGHAWARPSGNGGVVVGVDDFARAVIGPLQDVDLPAAGTPLRQGETAFTLRGAAGPLPVVSPVDGLVVATNREARTGAVERDPYGDGWLVEVHTPRLDTNARQLLSGSAARAYMEDVARRLRGVVAPTLGPALADGGLPVSGFAAELPPEAWQRIKSEFFLAEGGGASWKA